MSRGLSSPWADSATRKPSSGSLRDRRRGSSPATARCPGVARRRGVRRLPGLRLPGVVLRDAAHPRLLLQGALTLDVALDNGYDGARPGRADHGDKERRHDQRRRSRAPSGGESPTTAAPHRGAVHQQHSQERDNEGEGWAAADSGPARIGGIRLREGQPSPREAAERCTAAHGFQHDPPGGSEQRPARYGEEAGQRHRDEREDQALSRREDEPRHYAKVRQPDDQRSEESRTENAARSESGPGVPAANSQDQSRAERGQEPQIERRESGVEEESAGGGGRPGTERCGTELRGTQEGDAHEGTSQTFAVRNRRMSAWSNRATEVAARTGWTGAKYASAPLTPMASTTSLLQTGQPTAKAERSPAPRARPVRGRSVTRPRGLGPGRRVRTWPREGPRVRS